MLIYQHSDRYSGHQESVKEVLNAILRLKINFMRILELQNSLCHCLYYVGMPIPNLDQSLAKAEEKRKFQKS